MKPKTQLIELEKAFEIKVLENLGLKSKNPVYDYISAAGHIFAEEILLIT